MNNRTTKRRSAKDRIKARMATLDGMFVFQSLVRGDIDKKVAQVEQFVHNKRINECNDELAYTDSMKRFHGK